MSDAERIKERLSILEVVEGYVKLSKAGSSYKGLSPFTTEKTPSFFVSPDKGLYHCFSTGKGGDMFTFIQEIEGVGFPEALEILARKAGIELEHVDRGSSEEDEVRACLDAAQIFFEEELEKHPEALSYFTGRGVDEATCKRFRLGYAPASFDALKTRLSSYPELTLVKAGLLRKKETGRVYDYFRNRLMFPINDRQGRIAGFSGRVLNAEDIPKYLNSPESPVYNKSSILYGLDRAKQGIRALSCVILVEGQMDLILSHQVGFTNTVATSGTALTKMHLEVLKGLTENLVLAFDSDKAGLNSSLKAASLALPMGFSVKLALLPEGKDPADMLLASKEDFKRAVKEARHVGIALVNALEARTSDRDKLLRVLNRSILPLFALERSLIDRDEALKIISRELDISFDTLLREVRKYGNQASYSPSTEASTTLVNLEEQLSADLLALKDVFESRGDQEMLGRINEAYGLLSKMRTNQSTIPAERVAERLFTIEERLGALDGEKILARLVEETILRAELQLLVHQRKALSLALKQRPLSEEHENDLLKRVSSLDKQRQMLLDKLSSLI